MDWSCNLTFKELTDFLQRLVKADKSARFRHLQRFLQHCRHLADKSPGSNETKNSLYPVLRLLVPLLDKERGAYKMKETALAGMYIEFLQLGKNSVDALKLKNYKVPTAVQDDAGDFASVLYTVMQQRCYESTDISCSEINQKLDQIVRLNNNEGRREVAGLFKDLFLRMDALQQKWLIRIILKEMKISMGNNSVLSAFHRDAKELYEVNSNLKKVCELLHDPEVRMNEIQIQIFSPFKPQLADRVAISKLDLIIKGKECYIETKYDGERMQAHMENGRFKFFSRNGSDFTDEFGHSASDKDKFSSFLASSLSPEVKSVILDGEICAWNHQTQTIIQKSQQNNIRNIKTDHRNLQQCLVIYDICYLNGQVLTNTPLSERIKIYERVVHPMPGRIQLSHRMIVRSKSEVIEALNDAIDNREEGLVLKDPLSIYKPNARSGSGWIKLKPDYENQLMDQIDLLVLGGYFGSGKGGGKITHFLMGLADRSGDTEKFVTFCRVSSGFSAADIEDMVGRCGKQLKTPTSNINCGRDKPNVWFDPRSSPVLQVNAAEITRSESYSAGCTLRFPRVERLREDKDYSSCTTIQEITKLREMGDGKLCNGVRLIDSEVETPRKRIKISTKPTLGSEYKHIDYSNERIETFHLKDKIIVVEPSNDIELKHKLERIVVKHGGMVEQNFKEGRTFCFIQTAGTVKAKNIIDQGSVDVVKSSWILDCETTFRMFGPHDTVFATEKTKSKWKTEYDEFGDSYHDLANVQSLTLSMDAVAKKGSRDSLETLDLEELESYLQDFKYFLFRGLRLYLEYGGEEKDKRTLDTALVRFYGASVVQGNSIILEQDESFMKQDESSLEQDESCLEQDESCLEQDESSLVQDACSPEQVLGNVSHVVFFNPTPDIIHKYKRIRRSINSGTESLFQFVISDWISESISAGRLLPEKDFYPEP